MIKNPFLIGFLTSSNAIEIEDKEIIPFGLALVPTRNITRF